ncbi:MAG: gamma carbonic anhydrase family protein [Deltaproteobacteria bacterium]|nr:gamma carbonic anhydrase family protein [Candidatus Anaeroferrophillacea bacterium]
MPIFAFEGRRPVIDRQAYVSETAIVIGDVRIGPRVYVGHGAILRGDYGTIIVGAESAIEEGAVMHINPGTECRLETRVTVGHGAKLHCPFIGSGAVIGIGAILSFNVRVGSWAIVAEGAVVPNGKEIPPEVIVAGNPARQIGEVTERHREFWNYGKDIYVDLARRYPAGLERLAPGEVVV